MKVAFVTPRMIVGGAETYIIRKANWLIEHGDEVVVISEGGCYVEKLPLQVKHIELKNIASPPYILSNKDFDSLLDSLTNILRDEAVDVIETHNTFPVLYVAMTYKRHRIPFLLNVLNELSYDKNWQLCKLTSVLDKFGLYYTLTSTMNKYIMSKCGIELHPQLIPIPMNLPLYREHEEGDYILTVGRMSPEKMYVKYLIVAFADVIQRLHCNVKLLIVGDGDLKSEVQSVADKANATLGTNAVSLLGIVTGKELDTLYSRCIAFVGVGTSMLISAAHAKPTIIGGVYKGEEQYAFGFWGMNVEEDKFEICGSPNIEYRRSSYQEILEQVLSVAAEKRKEYGTTAYHLLQSNYDLNVVMQKWKSIFIGMLSKKANRQILVWISQLLICYNKYILRLCYLGYQPLKKMKLCRKK